MVLIPVHCPYCETEQLVKRGKTETRKQRYLCQNDACAHRVFIRDYSYRAYWPAVKQLENGYDIRTVQELLGHKNVRTTMIYTHVLNKGG